MKRAPILSIIASLFAAAVSGAKEFPATSAVEFHAAAKAAGPGDSIVLSGGPFSGIHLSELRGAEGKALTIRGRSADQPARFVGGNRFVGGMAPLAWVGCRGGHVHHNTIYKPDKWVARILQENTNEGFKPATGGVFEKNLILFDSRVRTFVNVGGGTAPESFAFRDNAWFDLDGRKRKPDLPTPETGGVYGIDPKLSNPGAKTMAVTSGAVPLKDKGADAFR